MKAQGQGPCPVRAMQAYLQVRGGWPGPLLQYVTAILSWEMTLTRSCGVLYSSVTWTQQHSTASFCTGAATTAAQLGMSDSWRRMLGCWKLNAFKQYICCKALTSTLQITDTRGGTPHCSSNLEGSLRSHLCLRQGLPWGCTHNVNIYYVAMFHHLVKVVRKTSRSWGWH